MRTGLWILLFLFWVPAQAGLLDKFGSTGGDDFLPVEQAFPVSADPLPGEVFVTWNNASGYYLYQHRIYLTQGDQRLEPVYWSVDGKEKYDEAFGDIIAYYGDLEVRFDTSSLPAGLATLHYQGCADAGLCSPPQTLDITLVSAPVGLPVPEPDTTTNTISDGADNWFTGRSVFAIIGIFFLLGLGLTFTPCVLPMVPILTSVVLGGGKTTAGRGFWLSFLYVSGMA